jgi:DNA-binding CsgD family transcriptional regulator
VETKSKGISVADIGNFFLATVLLSQYGVIISMSCVLHDYVKGYLQTNAPLLPNDIRSWVEKTLPLLNESTLTQSKDLSSPMGLLRCSLHTNTLVGHVYTLTIKRSGNDLNYMWLTVKGLTYRECEITYWMAQGKRNDEIGVLVGCARRTVDKHIQHILAKFGSETRGAAANEAGILLRSLARTE